MMFLCLCKVVLVVIVWTILYIYDVNNKVHSMEKVVTMATKSFTSEFKLNKKTSNKLINALDKSRKVDHEIKQPVNTIRDVDTINVIMKNFITRHGE